MPDSSKNFNNSSTNNQPDNVLQNNDLQKNNLKEEKAQEDNSSSTLYKISKKIQSLSICNNSESFDLKIEPCSYIIFKFNDNNEFKPFQLKLSNPTNTTQCYKIRCTSKEIFRVKTPVGYLQPKESIFITFSLKAEPKDDGHFFVFYHIAAKNPPEKPRDLWTSSTSHDKSLRIPVKILNKDDTLWTPNKAFTLNQNKLNENDVKEGLIDTKEKDEKENIDQNNTEKNEVTQNNNESKEINNLNETSEFKINHKKKVSKKKSLKEKNNGTEMKMQSSKKKSKR